MTNPIQKKIQAIENSPVLLKYGLNDKTGHEAYTRAKLIEDFLDLEDNDLILNSDYSIYDIVYNNPSSTVKPKNNSLQETMKTVPTAIKACVYDNLTQSWTFYNHTDVSDLIDHLLSKRFVITWNSRSSHDLYLEKYGNISEQMTITNRKLMNIDLCNLIQIKKKGYYKYARLVETS